MKADELKKSPAVDACDELMAIVAHELRQPLAAIAGWTELLKKRELTKAQRHRAIEIIARSAAAQRRILDDLLDHASIARGQLCLQRTTVDVAELATATAEAMSPVALERSINLQCRTSPPAPVYGDADRLRQVFSNLIVNAIRHSPGGSRVAVEVEGADGHVLVRIRDSGVGIVPHLLPHVFEPFRRGERATYPGLGLALPSVGTSSSCIRARSKPRAREKGLGRPSRFGCRARMSAVSAKKTGMAFGNRRSQFRNHGFDAVGARH